MLAERDQHKETLAAGLLDLLSFPMSDGKLSFGLGEVQSPKRRICTFWQRSRSIIPRYAMLRTNWLYSVSCPPFPTLRCTESNSCIDCLNSLALVAGEVGYIKPQLVDSDIIDVVGGRHPMAEALRSDPFVPNDIALGGVRNFHPPVQKRSNCFEIGTTQA